MKNNTAISVNITAHNEGLLLYKTLRSVEVFCSYFKVRNNDNVEVNLTLDNPDKETSRIVAGFQSPHFKINAYKVNFGDLALCRNFLVEKSKGEYCKFIDGDDLFSENYLHEAYKLAKSMGGMNIYSPEFLVSFGKYNYIVRKYDFNSDEFKTVNSFAENYFISQSFALTKIFKSIPYRPNTDGYGMEDWDWNNTALAKGYKFYNVKDTLFFYRRKNQSLVTSQTANKAALRPNDFFKPEIFSKFSSYSINAPITKIKNNQIKNKIKKYIKLSTFGSETLSIYLKDQYIANKKLIKPNTKHTENVSNVEDLGISKKCLEVWQKINQIEPLIRPSTAVLQTLEVGKYSTDSKVSLLYHELCKISTQNSSNHNHLVVVPHIVKGGADLTAIRLVKALSEIDDKNRVLVISTMNLTSHWAHKLEEFSNVDYISPYEIFNDFSKEELELVLLRILQNWNISHLHIINSEVAYQLLIDFKKVISTNIKILLHTYAFDMDKEGFIYNYIANGLVDTYPRVDKFITDSMTYKNQLCLINGFDQGKIECLKQPIKESLKPIQKSGRTNKIFWAGRISDAKLVEVAVEVGKKLAGQKIELHFYGHLDHEYALNDNFEKMIRDYKNIFYHGSFDNFSEIPTNEYDLLLFTSKNEGMPNILLEAISTNTYVVASSVGAIGEIVINNQNGIIVEEILKPDAYLYAIKDYYQKDLIGLSVEATKINNKLVSERTPDLYKEQVKKLINH